MSQIRYLNTVEIEAGAIKNLSSACKNMGMKRPLLVTDKGVVAAGLVAKVLELMRDVESVAVFDETPSNPTERAVMAAVEVYKENRCDGLIALGGGSSIDCAKGVCIAATHEGAMKGYATIEGGSPRISERVAPLIAIPTTAGTGSEVARGAVIIVDDGRKLGFHSWHLVPKLAILDPELTLGLPPFLTAATGMDAIAHCIEAFLAPTYNPPADGIGLDGFQRGWSNIVVATRDGSNVDARLQMLSASMQGALAFQKGLGCVHSLSHSLGGQNPGLHHGTLNALFLPAVIRFNAKADSVIRERRLERLVDAAGLGHPASAEQAADILAAAIKELNRQLKLPAGLAELGVTPECFERVVDGALADHCHKQNPRLASRDDYLDMLRESM